MKKIISRGGVFKYLIPGIIAVILLSGVLLSNKFITKQSLGSIYNIDEATNNFDNIQIGDSINYEVNGYSDWQVIGKDDYEGTIDVVSKTNTEDLSLESDHDKEYYENIFQETANKYIDNNYAIKARTVLSRDLDNFTYNENFWIDEINDGKITTSLKKKFYYWEYKKYKLYLIPIIKIYDENSFNYNEGDIYIYENNGINEWIVESTESQYINLLPKKPVEIVIDDISTDISSRETDVLNSLQKDGVVSVRKYVVYDDSARRASNLLDDFFNSQTEKIWLSGKYTYFYNRDGYIEQSGWGINYYENGKINYTYNIEFYDNKINGYRPVVTLKVKKIKKETKNIYDNIKIGDNIDYSANGYSNWKVLSIDNDLGTVDIISGGIVKNITLSGQDDWDNYEDIVQREVDEYKNGKNIVGITTVNSNNILSAFNIDNNSILSTYWILSKTSYKADDYTYNNAQVEKISYNIDAVYHNKYHDYLPEKISIKLYTKIEGDIGNMYSNPISNYSYTAGLRPVITLKLDSVEKLPEEETKKIEESTEKQEKIFIKEQETKNKDYKGPSKVDDSTSSTGNNNEIKTNDNDNTKKDNITDNNTSSVEKIVYKDKPSTRYQLIIQYIIIVLQLGVIIYLLLKRKNN